MSEGLNYGILYGLVKSERMKTERDILNLYEDGEYGKAEKLEGFLYNLRRQEALVLERLSSENDDGEIVE
jgi:hypothetical protein